MTRSRLHFPLTSTGWLVLAFAGFIAIGIARTLTTGKEAHNVNPALAAEISQDRSQGIDLAAAVPDARLGTGIRGDIWLEHGQGGEVLQVDAAISESRGSGEPPAETTCSATGRPAGTILDAAAGSPTNISLLARGSANGEGATSRAPSNHCLNSILDAIRQVEGAGPEAIGDGGKSRGCYQISAAYWKDSGVKLPYLKHVNDPVVCRTVIERYWRRYAPDALRTFDVRTLAAIHNGGPRGNRDSDYARHVEALVTSELKGKD